MNKTIRNSFISAALALFAAGSACAGVITSSKNVSYTATLSGNVLNLSIDASANAWNATELDVLTFNMAGLSSVTLVAAPTTGWTYSFKDNATGKDMATFTAVDANHTLLGAPLAFSFAFSGTDLDFAKLGLKATYLANGGQSDSITALNVSVAAADPADVPEPASVALLLGGLGLMGALRRKARRG